MAVKLTPDELDAGLDLVEQHGLSELMPRAFEVDAIRHSWTRIRELLAQLDLSDKSAFEPQPALTLVSPKSRYTVRPVHMLDPIDSILYSALVRRLAPSIEAARLPLKAKTVFSFRFNPSQSSRQFRMDRLWPEFVKQQAALTRKYSHVAFADISDFFPNVYLHRLKNALDDATQLTAESAVLARWLADWSPDGSPTSQGLPVGPLASNLLAEALLVEVDDYLKARGRVFVRYVDDYRIFCTSEAEATEALHELGEQLLLEERLSLNQRKTTVITTARLRKGLESPHAQLRKKRERFIAEVQQGDPYAMVEWDDLDARSKRWVTGLNANALLTDALKDDRGLDAQKVAFALQVLRALNEAAVVSHLLKRLSRLASVSRDVGNFLAAMAASAQPSALRIWSSIVLGFLGDQHSKPAFQRLWLLEPFAQRPEWNQLGQNDAALIKSLHRDPDVFVQRQLILALAHSPKRGSRIEVKQFKTHPSQWVRRAALYATRKLAKDERRHGFRRLKERHWTVRNAVDQAVALLADQ